MLPCRHHAFQRTDCPLPPFLSIFCPTLGLACLLWFEKIFFHRLQMGVALRLFSSTCTKPPIPSRCPSFSTTAPAPTLTTFPYYNAGFLATRVLPGAIGHSILRTSVNHGASHWVTVKTLSLCCWALIFVTQAESILGPSSFKLESNSLDSGKGWSAHPLDQNPSNWPKIDICFWLMRGEGSWIGHCPIER